MTDNNENGAMEDIQGINEESIDYTTQYKNNKRRLFMTPKLLVAILCIVISLFLVFGLQPLLQKLTSKNMVVVIATTDIPAGTLITAEMLKTEQVLNVPVMDIYNITTTDIIGKYATVDLLKEDFITTAKISPTLPMPNAFMYELKDGELAIACSVPSLASSVANKIVAGDVVTVYATYKNSVTDLGESVEVPELKYVRVLSVTTGSSESLQADDGTEKTISVVTFLANNRQALILAELEANAAVHLAVVERGDTERAAQYLELQKNYFEDLAAAEAAAAQALVDAAAEEGESNE